MAKPDGQMALNLVVQKLAKRLIELCGIFPLKTKRLLIVLLRWAWIMPLQHQPTYHHISARL